MRCRAGPLPLRRPQHLPTVCDGCGDPFSVSHAMDCKKGGLVVNRHDDVCDEWAGLCGKAINPSSIRDVPLIANSLGDGRRRQPNQNNPSPTTNRQSDSVLRGDIGVYNFWRSGTETIFDVRITDLDNATNRGRDPAKTLARHKSEKKRKYSQACADHRKHFTPLCFSTDGLPGNESKAAIKRLSSLLAAKWRKPYGNICAYVRSRIAIPLVRASSRCLRAEREPYT